MNETAIALLVNIGLVVLVVTGFSLSSVLLGPRRRLEGQKAMPYETGMPPMGPANASMTVSYHRFAVLFVIFDIDLAFLAPWVLLRDRLTLTAMVSISVFLALVGMTLAYVWKKGALES
ncbi:MAG: NADH-quinone oxidoreductase subunit A [Elusimicrobia bacterium]|nr:NADH-quinone oxidoreductase subunit A [Elusimicrobiota bacterium]